MNILMSYAYSNDLAPWVLDQMRTNGSRVLIDSGAFTAFSAGVKVSLEGYCGWLSKHKGTYDEYIALDVIGDHQATQDSYIKMIKMGFNPMGVVIIDDDPNSARRYVENNPRICVAGGALGQACLPWFPKRMELISRLTEHKAEIHALGFTPMGWDGKTCAKTVDSSSWKGARRFGIVNYWYPAARKLERAKWAGLTKDTVPDYLMRSLRGSQIDIEKCFQSSRRINRGNISVTNTISTASWLIRMVNAEKVYGQHLYLAGDGQDLFETIAIARHFNVDGSVNYEAVRRERGSFVKECKLRSRKATRYIQKALDNYWRVFGEL